MPSASIYLMMACRSFTSKPMWSSTRPLVGACGVAALANRSCSAGDVHDRRLVACAEPCRRTCFAYQATRLRQSPTSGSEEVNVLVLDRHRLGLVLQDFDAHAVRRFDECLIGPVEGVRRQHRHAGGLPLGHLLLHVVDDKSDMVDHRTHRAALSWRLFSEVQIDQHTRKTDGTRRRQGARAPGRPWRRRSSCWHPRRATRSANGPWSRPLR